MYSITWLLAPIVAAAVPYERYILAPENRELIPATVHKVRGLVNNADALTQSAGESATFHGVSSVTYDFGKNVAGLVSLDVGDATSSAAFLGVTFTESSLWISSEASDATADSGRDTPLWFPVGQGAGEYTPDAKYERGAFRYLTLVSNTTASVPVHRLRVNFKAAPLQNLRGYTGYFHCDDELVNRVWYAGAYTNQLCTINPDHGNALVHLDTISSTDNISLPQTDTWWNNYTITNGRSTTTDGAKRDRLVWPGDMSIALESIAVSTGDLYSIRMGLESLLALQHPNGRLPYAGRPFPSSIISYTYHLHSLIGMSYLYQFSGDQDWLSNHWNQYTQGLQWALSFVDNTGLANVTASADWLRFGMGGHNIEANAILYFVLQNAQELAQELNDTSSVPRWSHIAAGIKSAANKRLWDGENGLFRDNETTTLHPQDGNSWAIKANLTLSDHQKISISQALKARWGEYGAPAPEAGATVSPFIGGFELQAHYLANRPDTALDLIRLQWGFMLNDPRMTQSTFIEGYSTDGSLHYAPYTNDPRISHAHGWSTGPTSALTTYTAGIQLTGPAGSTWLITPQPGNLKTLHAGLTTSRGGFSTSLERTSDGGYKNFSITTPASTVGVVKLPGTKGTLVSKNGDRVRLVNGVATGLRGGTWELQQ
ncbi:hypothetical protein N7474_009941 [Penicillium riverlandense]|uniref:uncharacterized protein n=1 Tax=Penicillium riverlandense TaxID=1903569 RepID=UPI002548F0B1|nr:uncharacterized protein N7474_009941 [Penicillium riverlandense]KAJ5808672.1 hypothetical protein N7474_009941 [Penicillium riverlandense]